MRGFPDPGCSGSIIFCRHCYKPDRCAHMSLTSSSHISFSHTVLLLPPTIGNFSLVLDFSPHSSPHSVLCVIMHDTSRSGTQGTVQNLPGKEILDAALAQFEASLTGEQKKCLGTVTSLEDLVGLVEKLQKKYGDKSSSRWFGKLAPVLSWLTGLNQCVHAFLQASPREFVLLWGSLSLVLEVSTLQLPYNQANSPQTAISVRKTPTNTRLNFNRLLPGILAASSKWSKLLTRLVGYSRDLDTTPRCCRRGYRAPRLRKALSTFTLSSSVFATTLLRSSHGTRSVRIPSSIMTNSRQQNKLTAC